VALDEVKVSRCLLALRMSVTRASRRADVAFYKTNGRENSEWNLAGFCKLCEHSNGSQRSPVPLLAISTSLSTRWCFQVVSERIMMVQSNAHVNHVVSVFQMGKMSDQSYSSDGIM